MRTLNKDGGDHPPQNRRDPTELDPTCPVISFRKPWARVAGCTLKSLLAPSFASYSSGQETCEARVLPSGKDGWKALFSELPQLS